MRYLLTLITAALCLAGQAQFFEANTYDWSEPVYEKEELEDSLDFTYLLRKITYRYHFADEAFVQDKLYHVKVYLNSNEGLESFNKVYIPSASKSSDLIQFKARSIKGDEVKVVSKDDIKTGTYEESDNEYTYFAIEGLEVGTIVEYFYTVRQPPRTSGLLFDYQLEDIPVKRYELDVIFPSHLIFEAKVYNLSDSIQKDTTLEDENRIFLHVNNVPAFKAEPMAVTDANLGMVGFKLDKNLYTGKRNLTSYNEVAQNVVDFVNKELSKKEAKAVKKLYKKITASKKDFQNSAMAIDNYLKANFNYIDGSVAGLDDLTDAIEYQVLDNFIALKLYTNLLKLAETEYAIIYTNNRAKLKLDPDFEMNNFLQEILIQELDDNLYIDYSDPSARNGITNHMLMGCKALIINEMPLNDKKVAVTEISELPYRPASFSVDSLDVNVKFSEDLSNTTIKVSHILTGYSARTFQPLFDIIPDEEALDEFTEQLITYVDEDADLEEKSFENNSAELLGVKPFRAKGTLTNCNVLETAGADYLFTIGKLIGPQTELYNEDSIRRLDVENYFSKIYERTISFNVPEGYNVANIDDVVISETLNLEGEEVAKFESSYVKNGNSYEVTIIEYYEEMIYPKEVFNAYREVINAAADFNKVTLLLEKA